MSLVGVHELREISAPTGPAASVWLAPPGGRAGGWHQRRRAVMQALTERGAGRDTVIAVDEDLSGRGEGFSGAVFARAGRILLAHEAPGIVAVDEVSFTAPARVVPMLAWLQARPAHVRTWCGPAAAHLVAVPSGAEDGLHHDLDLDGPVEHRAEALSAAIAGHLNLVRGSLVLLDGDAESVAAVADRLRRTGRPPTIGHGQATAAALADHVRSVTAAALRQAEAGLAKRDAAVAGAVDTLAALNDGRVRTLLVADLPGDARTAWYGAELLCSAYRPTGTSAVGRARRGHLVDIAIRAALLTRAEIRVLAPWEGDALPDGLAGLAHAPDTG